jgi:hypothetical protein
MFKWFSSLWRKLNWLINFIYVYVSPIYKNLVEIIKDVQSSNLEDEVARKAVFQRITDFIQANGLKEIPDSILNLIIEATYQLIKRGKS